MWPGKSNLVSTLKVLIKWWCCQLNLPNTIYIQNIKGVNLLMSQIQHFYFVFKNHPPIKNFVNFMHVLHYGLLHYGMLRVLHITSFRSRFDALKLASHISHVLLWLHRQNGLIEKGDWPQWGGNHFRDYLSSCSW